jgi:hypothetical protein
VSARDQWLRAPDRPEMREKSGTVGPHVPTTGAALALGCKNGGPGRVTIGLPPAKVQRPGGKTGWGKDRPGQLETCISAKVARVRHFMK